MTTTAKPAKTNPMLFFVILISVCLIVYGISKIATPKKSPNDATPTKVMYVCGYDLCKSSGGYGEIALTEGINVWNHPDPNRGGVHHQVKAGDRVVIIDVTHVDGRTWYELEDGGWLSDLWLTKQKCTPDNIGDFTLNDC